MDAISVDEAVRSVIARAPRPIAKSRSLRNCAGRVLAKDVCATHDQPPFVSSAMDGYAIIKPAGGFEDAISFTVVGESQAGAGYKGRLSPGEAARIFTGAPVPEGATAVVIQENIIREGNRIRVKRDGWNDKSHIRPAARDFSRGDTLLTAGERLDAWRLSLAASAGRETLHVVRKPRIAILCAGNELVRPGKRLHDDQIFESNSIALITLVETWGGKALFLGLGRDDLDAISSRIADISADLIVTVGGASVGDYDLVKPALRTLGYLPDFERIDLRPGRPTSFGVLPDGRAVLGLPGNPASALVCAQLFLKAFIDKALGKPPMPIMCLPLDVDISANGAREAFVRSEIVTDAAGHSRLRPFSDQDSALIQVFARSGALIRRVEDAPAAKAGEWVPVIPLERL